MDHSQTKQALMLAPAQITSATNSTAIDCLGWGYLTIHALIGAIAANLTVFKLQHSHDNSTFADCTDGDITGTTEGAPTAAAGDNTIVTWYCDTRGLRRYVRVAATSTDCYIGIVGVLSVPRDGVTNATTRGVYAYDHVTK